MNGTSEDKNLNLVPDECEVIQPGDFDADGDMGLSDYPAFAVSMDGPDLTPQLPDPECLADYLTAFDLDSDSDIDLDDFKLFQLQFMGPR